MTDGDPGPSDGDAISVMPLLLYVYLCLSSIQENQVGCVVKCVCVCVCLIVFEYTKTFGFCLAIAFDRAACASVFRLAPFWQRLFGIVCLKQIFSPL